MSLSSFGGFFADGCRFGRHPFRRLTDLFCRQAGPGRWGDGNCLYLYVRDSGSRSWLLRVMIGGERVDLGLGAYPLVPLKRARELAAEYRAMARQGVDPRKLRESSSAPLVRESVESVINVRGKRWSRDTKVRYRRDLERFAFPLIGDKRVDEVTDDDCFELVNPTWDGRGSKGYRLRHKLVHLMDWAIAQKYRKDNPAQQILPRLGRVESDQQHQPSLPYEEVPDALVALLAEDVPQVFKLVILFIVLTASRLREATEARWSEFNFDQSLWTVPGSRMKKKKRHRVPLSRQALKILAHARELDPSGSLVFGFRRGRRVPRAVLSAEVGKVLGRLKLTDDEGRKVVMHGFRSTFTEWASDNTQVPEQVSEAALAHMARTSTRKAYLRRDLLKPRIPLMQQWADYAMPLERL